jgi:hypothetical protein
MLDWLWWVGYRIRGLDQAVRGFDQVMRGLGQTMGGLVGRQGF